MCTSVRLDATMNPMQMKMAMKFNIAQTIMYIWNLEGSFPKSEGATFKAMYSKDNRMFMITNVVTSPVRAVMFDMASYFFVRSVKCEFNRR